MSVLRLLVGDFTDWEHEQTALATVSLHLLRSGVGRDHRAAVDRCPLLIV